MNIRTICAVGFVILLAGCNTGLGPLRSELGRYHYTLYEPPRTDHGPGWTFVMAKTFDGRTAPLSVCSSIYPTITKKTGSLQLADISTTTDVGVDIALDLLKGLIESPVKAKAALSNVDSVEITWGAVVSEEIPQEDMFTPDGARRQIHPACYAALQRYKQEDGPSGVFVVHSAAIAKEMKYTFKAKQGADLGVGANLKEKLTVNVGVKAKQEGNTVLVITEPRYVGFTAYALEDFVPVGAYTAERADLKGRVFTFQEMSAFMR